MIGGGGGEECHFVRDKSYMDSPVVELGPLWLEAIDCRSKPLHETKGKTRLRVFLKSVWENVWF
jgi:hypothetical protein